MKPSHPFFLIVAGLSTVLYDGQALAQNSEMFPAPASVQTAQNGDNTSILKAGDYDFAYESYISGNYKIAFDVAMKRANKGDPAAQTLIAMLYMDGRVVTRDTEKALYWYGRAAEGGDPYAQFRYGVDLFNGIHVARNAQKGEDYIRKAAEAGLPAAYLYYGQILAQNAPPEERPDISLQWYLKGAAAGDVTAAYAASEILAVGTARTEKNEPAARTLLETAANSGNLTAQLELAKWMLDGRGGAADHEGAFNLTKIAAINNIPVAQANLAHCYQNGIGTKPDIISAAAWYLVAKQNNITVPEMEGMLAKLSPKQVQQAQMRKANLWNKP